MADMLESEIPSSVLSNLPLEVMEMVLEKIGVKDLVECVETYDDRLKTESQVQPSSHPSPPSLLHSLFSIESSVFGATT